MTMCDKIYKKSKTNFRNYGIYTFQNQNQFTIQITTQIWKISHTNTMIHVSDRIAEYQFILSDILLYSLHEITDSWIRYMIFYMSSVTYMYLTAPVLAWRGWHSDCLGRACRQSGQRHHLRHPEELPVLSARAGLQYRGGRDHEWAGLLHAGWGLDILSKLLNESQRCPNKGETCSVTCIYSIGQKL